MNLPTQVSDITDRSRGWWDEAPSMQRYVAIGIAALLVLVIGFVASSGVSDGDDEWEGRILYANLEFDEAAEISNRLRIMEVPHRLTPDATTILVPEDQYMDLRVTLAGEGFPKSGRIGYEIFDEAQLAMTDFLQQVNYQRALQSELEETLVRIDGVRDARVHLVIPEPSLFNEEQNPVTASVQLSLQRNIKLKPEPIEAIGYLVSASVEGLDIENVVITDDDGNLLSEEKDPLVKMASKQFEMQQQVERALEQKVQTLMDQVIGPGSSSIRINVELNFDRSDVTKE
ncbi:flagellar M-ring protein FliF, partial [bacterium]|nr:flagellar M-ring protein FliF [bacterium]